MLVLLCILVFVYHCGIGTYNALGLEPLPSLEFLYSATFLCGYVWLLKTEARTYALKPVYCLGLLVGVGWIIMIPYHFFKTRGAKGLIPLVALIGSFLAAHLLVLLVYLILSA